MPLLSAPRRRSCGLALGLALLCACRVAAEEEIRNWSEVFATQPRQGMPGKLENEGQYVHNIGNVLMNITNFGVIGSMPGSGQRFEWVASAQWPAGSGVEYLWGGGLWVGAERFGETSVSAWEVGQQRLILEYLPGPGDSEGIYSTYETAPGGARPPARNADDDGDGLYDEERLDGRDNDGDGFIDEDFAAISDQMFHCEYRDDDPRLRVQSIDHRPLGIHVLQTTMAWGEPAVDDIIAFDYTLINEGSTPLSNMYVGFFADFDIGARTRSGAGADDLAGFWMGRRTIQHGGRAVTVELPIGYMYDADGDEGQASGYVGITFLGESRRWGRNARPDAIFRRVQRPVELHNFQMWTRAATRGAGGRPGNDEDRYALLAGSAPGALGPREPPTFLRPPVQATIPNDYSILISHQASFLAPGDTVSVRMAMVFGSNFEEMVQNAAEARRVHGGFWTDFDADPTTGVDRAEALVCGPEYGGYKTPGECTEECELDPDCWIKIPVDSCVWIDWDCNPETGIDGKETFVPWLAESPPLPPNLRVVAQEDRIDLFWDNRSERTPDPFLQAFDFESYRIWRSDNWTRPLGTNERTGPGTENWFLMAEYDLPGNGIGRDTGLQDIFYRPNVPDDAVDFYRAWLEERPDQPPPDLPGLTPGQVDTAQALARGVRYYHFVDPPFVPGGIVGEPCPAEGECAPLETSAGPVASRCNGAGRCAETTTPPRPGVYVFYAVTATDHELQASPDGTLHLAGPGSGGSPNGNFRFVVPPTSPSSSEELRRGVKSIYVVPNPATPQSLAEWALDPNNTDPTGVKIEFHHLPRGRGNVSIYTLAADLVVVIPFDGRGGNGSLAWNLVSRKGQQVTSGVYLFVVESDAPGFERFVGRFVLVR